MHQKRLREKSETKFDCIVFAALNHTIISYSQQCLFDMGNLVNAHIELRCTTMDKIHQWKNMFRVLQTKLPNTIFALFGISVKPSSDF